MNRKQRKRRKTSFTAVVLAIVFALTNAVFPEPASAAGARDFESMKKALAAHIFSDGKIAGTIQSELADSIEAGVPYAAFISLGGREMRATVISATGATVRSAYDSAIAKAEKYIKDNNANVEYLKADLVNFVKAVESDKISLYISEARPGSFRYGISFDPKFQTALLEAELNANQLIDHANGKININKADTYLPNDKKLSGRLPKKLYLFSCRGYIADGSKCYTLGYRLNSGYGQRARGESPTAAEAKRIIDSNVKYLISTAKNDGSFVYGRSADTGNILPDYNILRHTGTAWELVKNYSITKDKRLKEPIDKAVEYLTKSIVYKDGQTAFVCDRDRNELILGGNGLALLMLAEYEKAFNTKQYRKLSDQLANGILYMMDQNTGDYRQIYYYGEAGKADFTVKQIREVSFYDGEATYALCVLYGVSKDKKWLDAAALAVDNFLREGREMHKDQWVAYTMNEITKYKPDDAYYSFAMKNLKADLPVIRSKKTPAFTDMEKLMSYFETYDRMKQSGKIGIAGGIREDDLIQTIFYRADFMLNSYFYPETAMYMKNPGQVMGAVYVRQDQFRIRIDDVQHFLGGYHRFYQQYGRLASYKEAA